MPLKYCPSYCPSSADPAPLSCNLSLVGPTPQGLVVAIFHCDRRVLATCQVSGRPAVDCKYIVGCLCGDPLPKLQSLPYLNSTTSSRILPSILPLIPSSSISPSFPYSCLRPIFPPNAPPPPSSSSSHLFLHTSSPFFTHSPPPQVTFLMEFMRLM